LRVAYYLALRLSEISLSPGGVTLIRRGRPLQCVGGVAQRARARKAQGAASRRGPQGQYISPRAPYKVRWAIACSARLCRRPLHRQRSTTRCVASMHVPVVEHGACGICRCAPSYTRRGASCRCVSTLWCVHMLCIADSWLHAHKYVLQRSKHACSYASHVACDMATSTI
jgi:hypothetical protein